MLFQNRLETPLHFLAGRDFIERLHGQLANDLLDKLIVRIGFDHLHQLQCRLLQLHTLRRRFIKRAVDDVRPMDQIAQRLIVKAELFVRDVGDELRARLARRIQKFLAGVSARKCASSAGVRNADW